MMAAPALISGAGALSGLFGGGGANSVSLPPQFNMPNMGDAANNSYDWTKQLYGNNVPAQILPQYQQVVGNMMANPYASGAQAGSGQAGQAGNIAGLNALSGGQVMQNAGQNLLGYVDPIMQQGFDPQGALYGRTAQRVQDQTRAGEAARGVNMSPYGAGVEGTTMANFNLDWNNQALGREATASGAASQLMGAGGQGIAGGAALQATAPGTIQQGAMMPYSTFNQMGGDQISALNALSGAGTASNQASQTGIQDLLAYLGVGNQAGSVANQNAQIGLNQQQQSFNQNQIYGQNLGSAMSGFNGSPMGQQGWGALGNMFQGSGGGGSFGAASSAAIF